MPARLPWFPFIIFFAATILGACSQAEDVGTVDAGFPGGGGRQDGGGPTDLGPLGLDAAPGADGQVADQGSNADAGGSDAAARDGGNSSQFGVCARLGLSLRALQPGASSYLFGDVAGDFSVQTIGGETWRLSENWSGCGSYLFVGYVPLVPQQGEPQTPTDELWASSVSPIIETPTHAHFFFMSWERTDAERRSRVESIQRRIDAALTASNLTSEQLAEQRARFHFVIDEPLRISGSVGSFLNDYVGYYQDDANLVDLGNRGRARAPFPFAFGIDRFQTWDSVGNLAEFVNGPWSLRMVSYLPAFYDHKASLEDRVAAETGVDTFNLLDEVVTERIFVRTATLPDASAMSRYDTLEVDVEVTCRERNVFACSEWDRIARVDVCQNADCSNRTELVRWITPYWRRGNRRWIMDASGLLGLVGPGGLQRFRIEMGPGWERKTRRDVRVTLRLSNQGRSNRGVGAVRAFGGGSFNQEYNLREPFVFMPPATSSKVELLLILSGHGQASGTNCAEWCDHRHVFTLNDTRLPEVAHTGRIGSVGGCGPAALQGVPPGQYGNWAPERAYWCPGLPVEHRRIDITSQVQLGRENRLLYQGNYRGSDAPAGGNISLSAYVVWFE